MKPWRVFRKNLTLMTVLEVHRLIIAVPSRSKYPLMFQLKSLLDKSADIEAFKETQEDENLERVDNKHEDDEYSEGSDSSQENDD